MFASGILLLPKEIQVSEKRSVVVCKHGLEGRSHDTFDPEVTGPYNAYGAKLADLGFVVYVPQNPYIGQDRFRVLQRKPTLCSGRYFRWLSVNTSKRWTGWSAWTLSTRNVSAFMASPMGVKPLCGYPPTGSVRSLNLLGRFQQVDRQERHLSLRLQLLFTGEYEMPEFDLGNTFNYATMVALIARCRS